MQNPWNALLISKAVGCVICKDIYIISASKFMQRMLCFRVKYFKRSGAVKAPIIAHAGLIAISRL